MLHTVQYSTVQYSTVQCSTVQYSTARLHFNIFLKSTQFFVCVKNYSLQ